MRRNVTWVAILLVVAALAVPAAAGPAPGTGGIHGVIIDSVTGGPLDTLDGDELIIVDAFNLDTMAKTRFLLSGSASSAYEFPALAAGYYKLRFRFFDQGGHLARYRWNNDKANFEVADEILVIGSASLEIDVTLKPMRGARVSGTLVERGTGIPLTSGCYSVHLYEASGIGMGFIIPVDASGYWETYKLAPAGRWTALGMYTTGQFDYDFDGTIDLDCGTSPAHLDTWYRGASGWPLFDSSLVAHGATFHTAATFAVAAGVPVAGIDIEMLPAPTCRGKTPTIFGTTLADEITGTGSRDIISGLSGADTVNGLGGNDLLCGDAGNDTLTGGAGLKDVAVGGVGTDTCDAETEFGCP